VEAFGSPKYLPLDSSNANAPRHDVFASHTPTSTNETSSVAELRKVYITLSYLNYSKMMRATISASSRQALRFSKRFILPAFRNQYHPPSSPSLLVVRYMSAWSKELEPHPIPSASEIVNPAAIEEAMEATKSAAKDSASARGWKGL
jgi:hypothetical protein